MAIKRIPSNAINSGEPYQDGDLVTGQMVNEVVKILKDGVNYNKYFIDAMFSGDTENSIIIGAPKGVAETEPLALVEDVTFLMGYLEDNNITPVNHLKAFVFRLVYNNPFDVNEVTGVIGLNYFRYYNGVWSHQHRVSLDTFIRGIANDFNLYENEDDVLNENLFIFQNANGVRSLLASNLRNYTSKLDVVNPPATLEVGQTRWNPQYKVPETRLNDEVVLQHGIEILRLVRNTTGADIPSGKVVYLVGDSIGQSPHILVGIASAYNLTGEEAVGVTTQSIPNNGFGFICVLGSMDYTHSYTGGQNLYLYSNGDISNLKPSGSNKSTVVHIGKALPNNRIEVNIKVLPKLVNLTDVELSNGGDYFYHNDMLKFDASTFKWVRSQDVEHLKTIVYQWNNASMAVPKAVKDQNGNIIDETYLDKSKDSTVAGSNTYTAHQQFQNSVFFEQDAVFFGPTSFDLNRVLYVGDGVDSTDAVNKRQLDTVSDKVQALEEKTTTIYDFKGSVLFENLPTTGQVTGDTYNILNDFTLDGEDYLAGTNVAWNGSGWDALGSHIPKADEIDFNGTGTNYLANETEVDGAIKTLDVKAKENADAILLRELLANKATDFSVVNDTKYPTTKAVSERLLNLPITALNNHTLREVFESGNLISQKTPAYTRITNQTYSNGLLSIEANTENGEHYADVRFDSNNLNPLDVIYTYTNLLDTNAKFSWRIYVWNGSSYNQTNIIFSTDELKQYTKQYQIPSGYQSGDGFIWRQQILNTSNNIVYTGNGEFIKTDNMGFINQTSLGISALTVSQMDYWFSVYQALKVSDTNAIFSLIKGLQDSKANIAQEAWITPTLLNGWTNVSGYTTRYKKDTLGVVWVEAFVTGGTSGSVIFTLPVDYRPTQNIVVTGNASGVIATIDVETNGNIRNIVGTNTFNHRFVFSFRTN